MKSVLSILSILTVLAFYITGAFVPETQGVVDTVDGFMLLSDADMAQQIGGIRWKYADNYQPESGQTATCQPGPFLECPRNNQVWHASLSNCVDCDWVNRNQTAYSEETIVGRIDSGCNMSYGSCTYWETPTYIKSCNQYMRPNCKY